MNTRLIFTLFLAAPLSACCLDCMTKPAAQQSKTVEAVPPDKVVVVPETDIHGTVNNAWAEPMYDTVKMQGEIDPANTYYRAPHQTVVEIRPRRFRDVTFTGDKK